MLPITLKERDHKVRNGLSSLETIFEHSHFKYANLLRKSVL